MTAQSLIDDTLVDIGVIAAGETPSTDERNYSLRLLNQMVDSLSSELTIPQITRSTVPLLSATSYTLPTEIMKVKSASVDSGTGMITPCKVVAAEEFSSGGGTAAEVFLMHDGGSTIYLRPAPIGGILEIFVYEPLEQWLTLSTDITLPKRGYELAVRRLLGLELATGFGRPINEQIAALAASAKTSIQGLNASVLGPPLPANPVTQPAA